jgi:hypothetical protein
MEKGKLIKAVIAIALCTVMMLQHSIVSAQTNGSRIECSIDSSNNNSQFISGNSALDDNGTPPEQRSAYITVDNKNEQKVIINEVIDKWETNVRQFKNEDGSYTAVAYAEPVNYLKDGQWTEIDNTLVSITDMKLGDVYQNRSNSFKATFSRTYGPTGLVVMEKELLSISWSLSTSRNPERQNSEAEVNNYSIQDDSLSYDERLMDTGITKSTILYKSIFADIDLRYTVSPEKIKEDIILNTPSSITSFVFDISVPGLKARINDDGSISFFNPDAPDVAVFNMPLPYMSDSSEEPALSFDVAMALSETESGYTLTITPNSDWINSKERVFPIFIDPTVYSSQVQSDIVDTYVHSGDVAGEHTLATLLVVGTKSGELCRSFIKTTIPTLPGVTVSDARLNLSITSGTTTWQNIDVYRVNSSWSSSTMTWAIQNSISKTLVKSNVTATSYSNSPSTLRYSCDVTGTIQDIYEGSLSNYGFMVKYTDESIIPTDYNRFYSSDYSTSTVRPTLVVTYTYAQTSGIINGEIYYIKNKNSGQYMDIEDAGTSNHTNVQQWPFNGALNQQWKAIYQTDGTYKLQAMNTTNKYLEVAYNSNSDGTNIDIYDGNYIEQYWYIMKNPSDSSYRILSKCSNYTKGAVVEYASTTAGANIIQYTYTASGNDEDDWYFYKAEFSSNDTYCVKNLSSNLYADVYDNSLTDGSPIIQFGGSYHSNQIWRFERQENGYYKIFPMHTNDRVMGLNTSNNVVSMANATNDRTQWTLEKVTGTTYKIRSKFDLTKYITVANNNSETVLTGSAYNSTKSQWVIDEYNNDSYWDGDTISASHAYYTATTTAIDSNMTDAVYSEGETWNGVTSAVNLDYISPGANSNGRDLLVTYRPSDGDDFNVECAITLPIIEGVQRTVKTFTPADASVDWDGCSIYVNMTTMSSLSISQRKAVVAHELGHALKLSHNREWDDLKNTSRQPENKASFPALMQPFIGVASGINYTFSEDHIMSWIITNFDRSALRSKWGS